jgi:hypothetical protein
MKNSPSKLNNFISFTIFSLFGFAAWGAIFWVSADRPNLEEARTMVEKFANKPERITLRTDGDYPIQVMLKTDWIETQHLKACSDVILKMQAKEVDKLLAGGFKVRSTEEIIEQVLKEG